MSPEHQYWIQERTPLGNYYDTLGLDPACTREEAEKRFADWVSSFPTLKHRLVLKVTVPLS